jgi:hypothetical protein
MAAVSTLETGQATITENRPAEFPYLTAPWTNRPKLRRTAPVASAVSLHFHPGTELVVAPSERGNEEERNQAETPRVNRAPNERRPVARSNDEAARLRSELARDLVQRVDQLLPLVGDLSLATHVQLLKRDLARCVGVLQDHPAEGNFLSIITLVESAMAQRKWKDYSRTVLELIRVAFDVGYRQVSVQFDDYDKIRRAFATKDVNVLPEIDLESMKLEDLENAEED